MKSFIKGGIGKVITDYGTKVMDIAKKGNLGRSLFSFIGSLRADSIQFPELPAPGTPATDKGGVIYVKDDGKPYFKSSTTSETDLTQGGGTATHIHEEVKNVEGSTIPAGTPVYAIDEVGNSGKVRIGKADASNAAKMPAIGILDTQLVNNAEGTATLIGIFNTNLSGFTGLDEGDIVYVASGGGLTATKPTGSGNLIQNMGIILKTNGTAIQGLQVSCIGRTNDVPNLDNGYIFYGNGSNQTVSTQLSNLLPPDLTVDGAGTVHANNYTNTTYSIQDGELSQNNFTNADHTKLNGIEASADVTDTTNVTAAGALMDSELTDLAGVKGVTISTLQVKPSEGAFANGDKTKLDGIEASATADQTKADIDALGIAATTAVSLTAGDKTINGNLVVTAGTSGDATLTLKADTDNNNEADNPYVAFEQDGAGVKAQIGFSGGNDEYPDSSTCTGAISNALIIGATGTGAARKVQIATQNTARVTVLDTGLVGIGKNDPAYALDVNGDLSVSGSVYKSFQQFNLSFEDDISNLEHYLSWRDQHETSTSNYTDIIDTNYLVPANGRVKCVYIRVGSRVTTRTMTVKVYSQNAGFQQSQVQQEAEANSISFTDDFEVFAFYFDNAEHFQAGDSIKISVQDSADSGDSQTYHVTAVLEFDYTQMGRTTSGELSSNGNP